MKNISLLILLMASLFVVGCSNSIGKTGAEADADFPGKPIQLIVPSPSGGSYDTVARTFEKVLPKYLPNGQSVMVVNKPGGSNTLGVSEVFKAKPDGYTIGFVPSSTITVQPHYGNTPYSYDSFQTIMRAAQVPGILFVRADAPYQSFAEWLAYVKQHPGQFTVATVAGAKNLLQSLNREAGLQMKLVPYEGFAPAMTALLGGHVQAAVTPPADARGPLESGKIRPLFTSAGKAPKGLDVQTLKQLGINIEENRLVGFIAPKGTPTNVLTVLHDALKKANEDPEVIAQLKKMGMEQYYGGPEEFQKDLAANYQIDGEILKHAGIAK